jgi:hypothetical protein
MPGCSSLSRGVALAVVLSACVAARGADSLPAPTLQIQDYEALGVVQLDLPTPSQDDDDPKKSVDGKDAGVGLVVPVRQMYVRPDSVLLQMNLYGQINSLLATRDSERVWNASTRYVLQKQFRNLDPGRPSPMQAVQLSLANLARVLREMPNPKLLPDEDLDTLDERHKKRLKELEALRIPPGTAKSEPEARAAILIAGEQARIADDRKQIGFRKKNPCFVVEFQNKDLAQTYLARGLMQPGGLNFLDRGKTTFWVTRAEGLPIKMETTANDGRVAIYQCYTEIRLNVGLKPELVSLGAPPGTRIISAVADVREKGWEERMDRQLADQVQRLESDRRRTFLPPTPAVPANGKPRRKR